jgi:hypothetical protein
MKTFSSVAAVMALWLGISFLLWLAYRIFRRHDGSKQMRLIGGAIGLAGEAGPVFSTIRTRASGRVTAEGNYRFSPGAPDETLREDVRALLNAIEAQSAYFERVNAAKKKIQQTFNVPDFLALSEILQIRRDLWAASEIFLMEGIRELGPEFADAKTFESFQAEARALLFEDHGTAAGEEAAADPVELRLSIAREDALAFKAQAESAIAAELERSRFPSAAELVAVPLSLMKSSVIALREVRYLLADAAITAQSLARAVSSKGLKGAAEELRRARTIAPGQFAAAFERAGGFARQGGQSLKRHYEFVIEAQELRARYAELLARTPELTEKGKQFLARLELERRAEQFRATSGDLIDRARQAMVVGIAYLIAGLQVLQAKITPAEHKRLVPVGLGAGGVATSGPAPAKTEKPLRVLLLPASEYSDGDLAQPNSRRPARRKAENPDPRPKTAPGEPIIADAPKERVRLRDVVTGAASHAGESRVRKPAPNAREAKAAKPRVAYSEGLKKTSFKELLAKTSKEPEEDQEILESGKSGGGAALEKSARSGSLLDRLASLEGQAPQLAAADTEPPPKSKGWRMPFRFKRK